MSTIIQMDGLIEALEDRIRQTSAGGTRCSLMAQLAIAQAQAGRLIRAETSAAGLRTEAGLLGVPRFLIYAMIVDGVIEYYKTISTTSQDKLRRGLLLAKAASDAELVAIANIWLAHTSFNFECFDELANSLAGAGEGLDLVPDQFAARYALSVADIAQYIGRHEIASAWYQHARILSRSVHDRALMVAIESNRLLLRLDRLRTARALGVGLSADSVSTMRTELNSLRAMHAGLGSESLLELLLWAEATEHQLSGRLSDAVETLRQMRSSGSTGRSVIGANSIEVELRVCELKAAGAVPEVLPECLSEAALIALSDDEALIAIALVKSLSNPDDTTSLSPSLIARFEVARAKCEKELARLHEISIAQDRFEPIVRQRARLARARKE